MHPPKISIVIPSLNKVRFIEETLKSIFRQNYPNLEVIIQDGGSTDGTLEIIKKYAKKYPRLLKWESKKDEGQLNAINIGFKKASGDILSYINADDIYKRGAFRKIEEAHFSNPDELWFAGRGRVIDGRGREIVKFTTWYKNLLLTINHYSLLLMVNYLMQPSVFITRNAYNKYGPFGGTKDFVMEYGLWLKLGRIQMPKLIDKNLSGFRIEQGTKTKLLSERLLREDERIIRTQTDNSLILFLHDFHNRLRLLVEKTI